MPFNGSGTFSLYTPGNPRVAGTTIAVAAINATNTDFATGLTNAVTRDGQGKMAATFSPAASASYDLGASAAKWRSLYVGTSVVFQGASFATTVNASPTANRSIILPDVGGYLAPVTATLADKISTNTGTATVNLVASGLSAHRYQQIVIIFNGVSLSGTNQILIQLSDTITGFITSGYVCGCSYMANAVSPVVSLGTGGGFNLITTGAGGTLMGHVTLNLTSVTATQYAWSISGGMQTTGATAINTVQGMVPLTSNIALPLVDGIRLTSSAGDTFDAGNVTVLGRW